MVSHGIVWYGVVRMVWYDMVRYGMVWYGMIWNGMVICKAKLHKHLRQRPLEAIFKVNCLLQLVLFIAHSFS